MLKVWIDGACEPVNPNGTASYGIVIKQEDKLLFSDSRIVGKGEGMSNNVAEYAGLLCFLGWYIANGNNEEAVVHSDSQLVVNQMNGNWKAKQGMYYMYYQTAKKTLQSLPNHRITFKWIPREENTIADNLSKYAVSKALS